MLPKTFVFPLAMLGGVFGVPIIEASLPMVSSNADTDAAFMESLSDFIAQREQIEADMVAGLIPFDFPSQEHYAEGPSLEQPQPALMETNEEANEIQAYDNEDSMIHNAIGEMRPQEPEPALVTKVSLSYHDDTCMAESPTEDLSHPAEESREAEPVHANEELGSFSSGEMVFPADLEMSSGSMKAGPPSDESLPPIDTPQSDKDEDTVQSAGLRIETGLFFDVSKHGNTDDECSDDDYNDYESDDEERGKLKKILFFLPASLQPDAKAAPPEAKSQVNSTVTSETSSLPTAANLTASSANSTFINGNSANEPARNSSSPRRPMPTFDNIYQILDSQASNARVLICLYWVLVSVVVDQVL